ncbi:hypothetical protein E1263_12995 [Kribbella antibiotica]|uniref:Toprim domain-containing protein n=1 Tax=Kribbella antibiotica TaxID=190195 RepID=A0A4V6PE80_9ACTN|nr:hypothetical protein [Kribbella antibiotica]TDD60007.1 hypothetical protein E1263_12995 [Kribbella antibiotica]
MDDPLDAFAIENVSRLGRGRWAGIPLCGALLSAEQARILGGHAATDTVVVMVSDNDSARERAIESLPDLAKIFRRVQAVDLSRGIAPAAMRTTRGGLQQLHEELLLSRPLVDYRSRRQARRAPTRRTDDISPDMKQGPSPEL